MTLETISIYEKDKTTNSGINNYIFCKNEITKQINKAKTNIKNRKQTSEKEEEIINDLRKSIQNIAKQAKSYSIHKKNKLTMSSNNKETTKEIQKEIAQYKSFEEKRRRVEQSCIWGLKKRSIKNLINGSLFKTLINQPENNLFQYKTKTSNKIYDVMILDKETINDKIIYQLETVDWKPFKFAVTMDKNQEDKHFTTSQNTTKIEWLDEIEKIIKNLLDKIPW